MKNSRSIYAGRLHEFADVAFVDQGAFEHRGGWDVFFRQRIGRTFNGRINLDVGCFDASHLCRVAAKNPQVGFIGLDWKCKAIYEGARRIRETGLANVVLIHGRAQAVRSLFADGEVDEIWVFHPDPCDRPAELKNRLIAEPFLVDAHAVLRNGKSTLSLKTDHPGYYQWLLGLFDLPQPAWFGEARNVGTRSAPSPRVRSRDLVRPERGNSLVPPGFRPVFSGQKTPDGSPVARFFPTLPEDIPSANDTILKRFKVITHSADYWNDAAAQAAASARAFAGEATLFESRFVRKKRPIYFLEIEKRSL